MASVEFEQDILLSLNLSLMATGSENLKNLDTTLKSIKSHDFTDFLRKITANLNTEEKRRVKRFLSARKSYLEMEKQFHT
jgi:hypothetical protein